MSQELINHNSDLKNLRDEGYEIEIHEGFLLINNIPYVNTEKQISKGILVSTLELSGNSTVSPTNHVALWIGEYPCNSEGVQLSNVINGTSNQVIKHGIIANFSCSQKPTNAQGNKINYNNYYQKMTCYIQMIESHAHVIDPNVTARTFRPQISEDNSVFQYIDTASSRAGILAINEKLKQNKVTIVGLGGTGSYILDLIAKTPIKEIHLFDNDAFLTHNAFRSPGAPSFEELSDQHTKVERFTKIYSQMHKNIIPHSYFVDDSNITELNSMDMVFLCVDNGKTRQTISRHLLENNVRFIDVGMDIFLNDERLGGSARITTCTPSFENAKNRLFVVNTEHDDNIEDAYSANIQIADLNALNAALAVIKWKKMCGFYHDLEHEHNSVFGIAGNILSNNEKYDE